MPRENMIGLRDLLIKPFSKTTNRMLFFVTLPKPIVVNTHKFPPYSQEKT